MKELEEMSFCSLAVRVLAEDGTAWGLGPRGSPQGLAGQGLHQTRREQVWPGSSEEQPPAPGTREGWGRPHKTLVRAVTSY